MPISTGEHVRRQHLLPGEEFSSLIEREVCLTAQQTAALFTEVCRTLAPAHRRGISHRQLTPNNLIVGMPAAKQIHSVRLINSASAGHESIGTALTFKKSQLLFPKQCFESPEIKEGFRGDTRSDVYSLGCLMYMAVTGMPPGTTAAHRRPSVLKIVRQTVQLVNYHVPASLEAVIQRCLSSDPQKRYANADDLLQALNSIHETAQRPVRYHLKRHLNSLKLALCSVGLIAVGAMAANLVTPKPHLEPGNITYNKHQFKIGDHVELNIQAPDRSKPFLFYVNDANTVMAFYPDQAEVDPRTGSVHLSKVGNRPMTVDPADGKLVLICIKTDAHAQDLAKALVSTKEWENDSDLPQLQLTGDELIDRALQLQRRAPDRISITIKPAPKSDADPALAGSRF